MIFSRLISFLFNQPKETVVMEKVKNYTDAQEARLAGFDVITPETALILAAEFGKDVKSVRAKAVRMGVYRAPVKAGKSGLPIERKEAIVAEIAALVGFNMEGLEKAPKQALIALRSALS